jgi:hypothetical protein
MIRANTYRSGAIRSFVLVCLLVVVLVGGTAIPALAAFRHLDDHRQHERRADRPCRDTSH